MTHSAFDTSVPFAGALHDFSRPLLERAASRKHVGPYLWSPAVPGTGRGFYMQHDTSELRCADHGAGFRLRVIEGSRSFAFNEFGDSYTPIVLRLPHGRGFLIGATMGAGMCAHFEPGVFHGDEYEAMYAAEQEAHRSAEAQEAFEAEENARLAQEELEDA